MAHFAQVIDNYVQRVLVLEEDQLPTLKQVYPEGVWLQCSYNTRDGVHYGEDGKPDGGVALRFNYPHIGYYYDEERDAFYRKQDKPADAMYFDDKTMGYKLPLPNKAVTGIGRPAKVSKIYLTDRGKNTMGPLVMGNLSANLNIQWVNTPEEADLAFPVTDQETRIFALRSEFKGLRPMSSRGMWNLTDRLLQQKLGIDVLPAWRGRTKEEVLALGNHPIFVKRQRTHAKDRSEIAYTVWPNPQAFVDAAPESFWAEQADPDVLYGEYIFQPVLAHPFTGLDLRIAVNAQSEVYFWNQSLMTHDDIDTLGQQIPFTGDCEAQKEQIRRVVKEQGLGVGVHMVQFARYEDKWVLVDWNTRLAAMHVGLFPTAYPVLDDVFRFMLGLELMHEADLLYYEQRSYRQHQVGREVETLVGDCGLFARWEGNQLSRVAAIGTTKREVSERYDTLDKALAQRKGAV